MRVAQILGALIFMFAAALPVGARAMPMPAVPVGMSAPAHCADCPDPSRTSTSPDKMQLCAALACAATPATLPTAAVLADRLVRRAGYTTATPFRWIAAECAPDPFPPRPTPPV